LPRQLLLAQFDTSLGKDPYFMPTDSEDVQNLPKSKPSKYLQLVS